MVLKIMTATEDCSKVTAIILIQPASYLQCARAAYTTSFKPSYYSLSGIINIKKPSYSDPHKKAYSV